MNKENQHKETLPYGVVSSEGINLYKGDCLEVMDKLISEGDFLVAFADRSQAGNAHHKNCAPVQED